MPDVRIARADDPRWAMVRVALGMAQMIGAIVTAILLIQLGVTKVTLIGTVVTCTLTSISVVLFGRRGRRAE